MPRFILEAEHQLDSDLLDYAADELVRMLSIGVAREMSAIAEFTNV